MFDIGFWELLVIGVIALLVIGPERLPSFIRSTANTIKSVKNVANGFKEEVSQQLRTHELHENLKKAEKMGMENIGGDIKKSVDELRAAAESVQEPYKKRSSASKTDDFFKSLTSDSATHATAEPIKSDLANSSEPAAAPANKQSQEPMQTQHNNESSDPKKAPSND